MKTVVYNGITLRMSGPSIVEIVDGELSITDVDPSFSVELVKPTKSNKKIKDPIDVSVRGSCAKIVREKFKKSGDTYYLLAHTENAIRTAFNSQGLGCKVSILDKLKDGKTLFEVTQK